MGEGVSWGQCFLGGHWPESMTVRVSMDTVTITTSCSQHLPSSVIATEWSLMEHGPGEIVTV